MFRVKKILFTLFHNRSRRVFVCNLNCSMDYSIIMHTKWMKKNTTKRISTTTHKSNRIIYSNNCFVSCTMDIFYKYTHTNHVQKSSRCFNSHWKLFFSLSLSLFVKRNKTKRTEKKKLFKIQRDVWILKLNFVGHFQIKTWWVLLLFSWVFTISFSVIFEWRFARLFPFFIYLLLLLFLFLYISAAFFYKNLLKNDHKIINH